MEEENGEKEKMREEMRELKRELEGLKKEKGKECEEIREERVMEP